MDRIREIFQSLSKTEIRYLKSYLSAFHNRGSNKALEMVELIEKSPDFSNGEMAQALYNNPKSKAFIMLKSRIMEKMLETLSLSVNFHNNPAFKDDPAAFETINLQKNIIYATLLRRRGLEGLAKEILEKCVKQADDMSLPEFKLQALIYLRNFSVSEQEVAWQYKIQIEEAQTQYQTDILGAGIFDEFRVLKADKSSGDQPKLKFLEEKTQLLEDRLNECYSARSHYFFLSMKVYLHEFKKEFEACKYVLEEMIDLLQSHEGLGHKNRLGIPYLQLSGIELRIGNFSSAMNSVDKALNYFHHHKRNYLSASLYKLFASIYSGKWKDTEEALAQTEWFRTQKHLGKIIGIVYFLEASLRYIQGNYREASDLLFEAPELQQDKEGWNPGIRIFEIMILIDQEYFDLATSKIESLRKHIARYDVEKRMEHIYRCLHLLERNAFDFQNLSSEIEELIILMNQETPWAAVGHEVIRFDFWLKAKQENKPFAPFFVKKMATLHALSFQE